MSEFVFSYYYFLYKKTPLSPRLGAVFLLLLSPLSPPRDVPRQKITNQRTNGKFECFSRGLPGQPGSLAGRSCSHLVEVVVATLTDKYLDNYVHSSPVEPQTAKSQKVSF